jgi:hypothetical protein
MQVFAPARGTRQSPPHNCTSRKRTGPEVSNAMFSFSFFRVAFANAVSLLFDSQHDRRRRASASRYEWHTPLWRTGDLVCTHTNPFEVYLIIILTSNSHIILLTGGEEQARPVTNGMSLYGGPATLLARTNPYEVLVIWFQVSNAHALFCRSLFAFTIEH